MIILVVEKLYYNGKYEEAQEAYDTAVIVDATSEARK